MALSAYFVSRKRSHLAVVAFFLFYFLDLALIFQNEYLGQNTDFPLDAFYGIDHPATFVYKKGMGHDFTLPFGGPFVVKPAESYTYWDHPFPTQKKAYILQTR